MVEAQMPEVADWAIHRALKIACSWQSLGDVKRNHEMQWAKMIIAFARYIEAHEEPPVDPLLIEAIELVIADDVTRTDRQIEAIRERRAGHEKVNLALAALKRGLALAGRGEGVE